MGGSYGGYMTDWIVTQTGRFKAAATMCSVSDIADLYYLSDAGDFTVEYFGEPWDEAEAYAAHSPITFAAKVTTPLLIQHGENDRRVPIMQAHKFYKALKKMGKTVEMEIFPRGGHVLSEPAQQAGDHAPQSGVVPEMAEPLIGAVAHGRCRLSRATCSIPRARPSRGPRWRSRRVSWHPKKVDATGQAATARWPTKASAASSTGHRSRAGAGRASRGSSCLARTSLVR